MKKEDQYLLVSQEIINEAKEAHKRYKGTQYKLLLQQFVKWRIKHKSLPATRFCYEANQFK